MPISSRVKLIVAHSALCLMILGDRCNPNSRGREGKKTTAKGKDATNQKGVPVTNKHEAGDKGTQSKGHLHPDPNSKTHSNKDAREQNKETSTHQNISAPKGKPGGISNVGNTCYLNSALQALAAFYPEMFKGKSSLATTGEKIVNKINTGQTVTQQEAKAFFEALKQSGWKGKQGYQEDTQEALLHIMNALNFPKATQVSQLTRVDTGATKQGRSSDPFRTLEMPIASPGQAVPTTKSMQDIVDEHFRAEEIDGYKWDGVTTKIKKALRILDNDKLTNNILPILVKRYSFDPTTGKPAKINTALQDTGSIVLRKGHLLGGKQDVPYELVGILEQSGSMGGGHYVAHVKRGEKWYLADDSYVSPSKEIQKAAGRGYVLFYRKKN